MKEKTDWLGIAVKCYNASAKKQMHVNEIAEIALQRNFISHKFSQEDLADKFAASLARNIKSSTAAFRKVKNDKGGLKRGIYTIKEFKPLQLTKIDQPSVSTNYTGKAGEYAVLSELLFRGFNASVMAVDEGMDVIASKFNKYFHIQVKTANGSDIKPYNTSVRKEAFQHSIETFYVVVLRRSKRTRYMNDFIVFSSATIRDLIAKRIISDTANMNLKISVVGERFYLNGLQEEITHLVNDFDRIR